VKRFGRFWWDFVVGDDWVAAAGVAVAIGATAATEAWWLLPPAAVLVLYVTVRRAIRPSAKRARSSPAATAGSTDQA
jgi:divalent metal cation (Fe/Co/Zn/Cd) transporter